MMKHAVGFDSRLIYRNRQILLSLAIGSVKNFSFNGTGDYLFNHQLFITICMKKKKKTKTEDMDNDDKKS